MFMISRKKLSMVQFVSMLAWLVKALQCVHARVPSYVQPLRYGELFRITISIQALFHFWAALPIFASFFTVPLQWLHDGRDGVSNHQPHDCLLNPLFKRRSKKASKLRSASLAFVHGVHRWPVNSPHKWPVTRKMFPFDDVIMHKLDLAQVCSVWIFLVMLLFSISLLSYYTTVIIMNLYGGNRMIFIHITCCKLLLCNHVEMFLGLVVEQQFYDF